MRQIREAFPDDASWADVKMQVQGFDMEEAPHVWIEQFSQRTTELLKSADWFKAGRHFDVMSKILETADSATTRCIDVSYVENLMWDMDVEGKRQSWSCLPQNLRALYVAMWGERPFMRESLRDS